jgi:hypothetical protein
MISESEFAATEIEKVSTGTLVQRKLLMIR